METQEGLSILGYQELRRKRAKTQVATCDAATE
jgi:hypothetical protein